MDTSILKGATVDSLEPSPTWMLHEISSNKPFLKKKTKKKKQK